MNNTAAVVYVRLADWKAMAVSPLDTDSLLKHSLKDKHGAINWLYH